MMIFVEIALLYAFAGAVVCAVWAFIRAAVGDETSLGQILAAVALWPVVFFFLARAALE
jgi:hypothetical protein